MSLADPLPRQPPPRAVPPPRPEPPGIDNLFLPIKDLRDEFAHTLGQYRRQRGKRLLECLGQEFRTNLHRWIEGDYSDILSTQFDDPTSLALEMVYRTGGMIGRLHAPGITQVAHLCTDDHRRDSPRGGARLRILVLDLISQIVQFHSDSKTGEDLADVLVAATADDLNSLWDAFQQCVKRAEIKVLFIFLGSVDILYEDCRTMPEFKLFISRIGMMLKVTSVVVKVMVTSRNRKVADMFTIKGPT